MFGSGAQIILVTPKDSVIHAQSFLKTMIRKLEIRSESDMRLMRPLFLIDTDRQIHQLFNIGRHIGTWPMFIYSLINYLKAKRQSKKTHPEKPAMNIHQKKRDLLNFLRKKFQNKIKEPKHCAGGMLLLENHQVLFKVLVLI